MLNDTQYNWSVRHTGIVSLSKLAGCLNISFHVNLMTDSRH